MRQLKFRAWDKKRKEWYGEGNPNILTFKGFAIFGECTLICTPLVEDLPNLEITQFTGLLDKSGKEIYEGDIVDIGAQGITQVTFSEGCFYTVTNGGNYRCGGWNSDAIEIIGNIYKNPELIE